MSLARLRARLPKAERIGVATLSGHQLRFHKISNKDGTGKGDAFYTGDLNDQIFGVVYRIALSDKTVLDRIEGVGIGYEVKTVSAIILDGKPVEAFAYYATNIDPDLRPLDWYLQHVIRGAKENRLPDDYITRISATPCQRDSDEGRRMHELSIYFQE